MFDRGRAPIVALAIALVPVGASAQQSLAAQQARLAALKAAAAQADSIAVRADSILQARRVLDTVRSGTLRVITDSAVAPKIRGAVEYAWTVLASHLGADTVLLSHPFGVFAVPGMALPVSVEATARVDTASGRHDVPAMVLGLVESALIQRAGGQYRGWDGSLGFATDTTRLFNLAYISLVTAPSRAVRLCRAGDISACTAALGLGPDSDRVATWYSADDLRTLFGRSGWLWNYGGIQLLSACRGGDDAACWELAARHAGSLVAPLGVAARTSLVALALARGGDGAYRRLLADSAGPVATQLASAARMPFDDLVGVWRSRVLQAAPPGTTGASARTEYAAAGWIVLLMALALRSARWRLN